MKNGQNYPENEPEGDVVLAVLQSWSRLTRVVSEEVDETNVEVMIDGEEAKDDLTGPADNEEEVVEVDSPDDQTQLDGDVASEEDTNHVDNIAEDQNILSRKSNACD